MKKDTFRFTIDINKKVHVLLRTIAAQSETSMREIVLRGIRDEIHKFYEKNNSMDIISAERNPKLKDTINIVTKYPIRIGNVWINSDTLEYFIATLTNENEVTWESIDGPYT